MRGTGIQTWIITLLLAQAFISSNQRGAVALARPTAIEQFKAPNARTTKDLIEQWKKSDAALWSYVDEHVPDVLEHTGSSVFDEHLKGVQAVLRHWGAPVHLQSAGLFHSIYGTEGFQGFSLPLSQRQVIQELIGPRAERLCFWFCMVDRWTFDETVLDWGEADGTTTATESTSTTTQIDHRFTLRSRPELGRFEMHLDKEEWLDFMELTLADWMEQVEGAAEMPSKLFHWKTGEAFAYRRLAYRKMSKILASQRPGRLGTVVPATLEAVMGTEAANTQHLVQSRTPPMSEAAAAALEALRSAGYDLPIDMSPQPHSELRECDNAAV